MTRVIKAWEITSQQGERGPQGACPCTDGLSASSEHLLFISPPAVGLRVLTMMWLHHGITVAWR